MSDVKNYFSKLSLKYQGSEEERSCVELIFSEIDISLGDKRLNSLSARTYNATACEKIFALLEKALSPQEHPWKTLYKSLLLLHTIILYGSELAIDKCIGLCRIVNPLQEYNSALVKKGFFYGGGGMDYGAPVRMEAKIINAILINDNNIRKARSEARSGQDSLVPMGTDTLLSLEDHNPSSGMGAVSFGQGLETSVGAGFGLHAVPGMYENRPERYFDNSNDPRKRPSDQQVDSQYTRDIQAPSLLDLVFDDHGHSNTATNLPEAQYLPALEKQKELERQLAEQTAQLKKLQELQAQQGQLQALQLQQPQHSQQYNQLNQQYNNQNQANGNFNNYPVPAAAPLVSDSLLDLNHHDTATALLQHNNPHYPQPGHMQNNVSAPHVSHMHHSYSPTVATFGSLHDLNVHASASAIMNHNNPPQQGQGVNNIGYSTPAGYTHAHQQQSHQHMSPMEQHYPVHASLGTGPTNSASAAFMPAPSVPHHSSAPSTPHSNNAYQTQQYPNTAMSTGFVPPGPPQQQQQQQQPYGAMSGVPPPPIPPQFQNSQYTSGNYPQQQPLQSQYGMNQPQQTSYGSQYGAQQSVFQQQPYQQQQQQQQAQQQSYGQPNQAPPPVPPRAPF